MRGSKANHDPRRDPVIVDWGVVSPLGLGRGAFAQALRECRSAVGVEEVEGAGACAVARVQGDFTPWRSEAFVLHALGQVQETLEAARPHIEPERWGISAAASKPDLLRFWETPHPETLPIHELMADAPARQLARATGFCGPRAARAAACATGLLNLLAVADWIRWGWCDGALAGAAEAALHPAYLCSFRGLGALARAGSYPFDARHEGFGASEGAAVIVVLSREAAERAGLRPIALIAGGTTGADPGHPVRIDATGAPIAAMGRRALDDAGWASSEVDMVAAHGTATPTNDRAEAAAIRLLLGEAAPRVPVHSLKGASGHLMGAAGLVEVAACCEAMAGSFIPGNAGFGSPAEDCAGLCLPKLPIKRRPARILKWSFGFGGQLAAAALSAEY